MKIKSCFLTIASSVVMAQCILAQDQNQQIASIDKVKEAIKNKIGNLIQIEYMKDSTGYRDAYSDGNELQLVSIFIKDNTIDKHLAWYFSKGQLIYVEQNWQNNITNRLIDNEKLYLCNGHLTCLIKNGVRTPINSKEFQRADSATAPYGEKLELEYAGKAKVGNSK